MKKLFLAAICFLALFFVACGMGWCAPFLVCDPQAGVDYYQISGDSFWTVNILAQPDGSIRSDVGTIGVGTHNIQVKACSNLWGCSSSAPFTFSKTVPATPANIHIVP